MESLTELSISCASTWMASAAQECSTPGSSSLCSPSRFFMGPCQGPHLLVAEWVATVTVAVGGSDAPLAVLLTWLGPAGVLGSQSLMTVPR